MIIFKLLVPIGTVLTVLMLPRVAVLGFQCSARVQSARISQNCDLSRVYSLAKQTTMSSRNTRRSVRLSSSSSSNLESADAEVAPRKRKIVPKKKATPVASKKPKATSQDAVKQSKYTPIEGMPWHSMFTKGDEEYDKYMATEWGFEKRGTVALFEKISLEGAQSGLSWLTVLRKREAYRRVFHQFDVDRVAAMTDADVERILAEDDKANARNMVVRHSGKVNSVINNARCIQALQKDYPDQQDYFDKYIWSFVDDKPILNMKWDGKILEHANTQTKESQAMSKALKKLGFRFVGPTTMYAMMQSCGLVIDHPVDSPEWIAARDRLQKRPGGYQEQEME